MKKIKILHKRFSKPISCLTAYSPSIANILDGKIDLILVGDSIGSTLYGMNNTQGVTMDMMKNHGAAVNKTIKKSLKVLDMPYKTYDNKIDAYKNAKILLNHCKPDLLKIEISEKKLVILKYLVDKIGTPEFVFKGSGSQKYLVSSKITGLNDKSNIEKSSGFKLEWEIEGTPAQYNMPEKLKPRPFNKDKDLISGFGFQIKEGCMEKKIVDIIKFKENMDSFSAGFIKLFEEALPASKEFIKVTCKPPCETAYHNREAKKEDILKATKVDGIYDSDPVKNKNAKKFKKISYDEVIKNDLRIMDTSSISLAKENKISIIVFSLLEKNSLLHVINGDGNFTIIN